MDQQQDNQDKEILWKIVANPAHEGMMYKRDLLRLVDKYPQSGILRALLVHSGDQQSLTEAAVHFGGSLLYKIVHTPTTLQPVSRSQVITADRPAMSTSFRHAITPPEERPDRAEIQRESAANLETALKSQFPVNADYDKPFTEQIVAAVQELSPEKPKSERPAVAEEDYSSLVEVPIPEPGVSVQHTDESFYNKQNTALAAHKHVDDDVFEEIVGIEHIHIEPVAPAAHKEAGLSETNSTEAAAPENVEENEEAADTLVADKAEDDAPAAAVEAQEYAGDVTIVEKGGDDMAFQQHTVNDAVRAAETAIAEAQEPEITEAEPQATEVITEQEPAEALTEVEDTAQAVNSENADAIPDSPAPIQTDEPVEAEGAAEEVATEAEFAEDADSAAKESGFNYAPIADYFPVDDDLDVLDILPLRKKHDTVENTADVTAHQDDTQSNVSKYNDDKMPYTFLWWLDKTRREHEHTHRPFAGQPEDQTNLVTEPLEHQYIENIFHLTTIDELNKNIQPIEPEVKRKEKGDDLIARFIQEDPQHITPGISADRLDMENKDIESKVKKGAEDTGELVTETLAKIYTDQMRYDKAISTYKKLMLKFPEKSSYFASQVEILEKKVN